VDGFVSTRTVEGSRLARSSNNSARLDASARTAPSLHAPIPRHGPLVVAGAGDAEASRRRGAAPEEAEGVQRRPAGQHTERRAERRAGACKNATLQVRRTCTSSRWRASTRARRRADRPCSAARVQPQNAICTPRPGAIPTDTPGAADFRGSCAVLRQGSEGRAWRVRVPDAPTLTAPGASWWPRAHPPADFELFAGDCPLAPSICPPLGRARPPRVDQRTITTRGGARDLPELAEANGCGGARCGDAVRGPPPPSAWAHRAQ
jgi:hypothetical protein